MNCKKCGNSLFTITIKDCADCEHNGAYDEYIYDQAIIDEKNINRLQSAIEGECNMGTSHDNGCYFFECANCDSLSNLPLLWD